ncbi:MAG: DUF721 domain-containing protein [Candidatus Magasanikbacteria bacterium]|nr:DUF721 domain-containing protein [Candidatus Magasanikbacteria bacterium]
MAMRTLKSMLSLSLNKNGLAKQVTIAQVLAQVRQELAQFLGDGAGELAQPLHLKNGTLTVRCTHSAVAQEIKINEQKILQSLHRQFPGLSIKSVHPIC